MCASMTEKKTCRHRLNRCGARRIKHAAAEGGNPVLIIIDEQNELYWGISPPPIYIIIEPLT